MLDLKIETFLCACKNMSFTKTAEELHITQSAVSQQIRSLEDYYGAKLFIYEKRALRLTPAGTSLERYMEAMYNDSARIREFIRDSNKLPALKIGTTMSVGDFYMPLYLSAFMRKNPNIRISVTRLDSRQIFRMLTEGILDFAFVEGNVDRSAYAAVPIAVDDIIAVCGKDYPIDTVSGFEQLFAYPILLREEGSGTREIFLSYLANKGYRLESFAFLSEFNSPLLIRRLLLDGCGFSVLYRTVVEDLLESGELRELSIPDFSLSHEFSAVWRRGSIYGEYYEHTINEIMQKL